MKAQSDMKKIPSCILDVMIPGLRPDSKQPEQQLRETGFSVAARKAPLPEYHPLLDVHLKHQWRKPEVKRHLKQSGFYSEKGELVDPNQDRAKIFGVRKELAQVERMLKAKQLQKDLRRHDHSTQLQRQHVIELKMQRISAQREAFQSTARAKKALTESLMSRLNATDRSAKSTGRLPDAGSRLRDRPSPLGSGVHQSTGELLLALADDADDSGSASASGSSFCASHASAMGDTGNLLNGTLDSNQSLPSTRGSSKNHRPGSSKSVGSVGSKESKQSQEKMTRVRSHRPGHESVAHESKVVRRSGLQRRHSSLGPNTFGNAPSLDRAARRSSTMELRRKLSLSAASSLEAPEEEESDPSLEVQLQKAKKTDLWTLSQQLDIPLGLLREAVALFKKHARLSSGLSESSRMLQGQDILKHGRISNGKVFDLLHQAASSSTCQDQQRQVDFNEFAIRYWSRGFAEDVVLSDDQMEMRELARIHGISYSDIEQYKRRYVAFDTDGSGEIEIDEFEALLYKLTKIPHGLELPHSRIETLWRMCTHTDSCNFEQFVVFYHTYFSEGGADPFEDFYQKASGRPM